jgi:uncharacterized MAPEG superfamily protein
MSTAAYCLVAAGLMPILWTGVAKVIGGRSRRFNNHDARGWQSGLTGLPARAHAAHLNSFEAFPLFAAAVLYALHRGLPAEQLDLLALIYIGFRLAYGIFYLTDWATLRSVAWLGALLVALRIFQQAIGMN